MGNTPGGRKSVRRCNSELTLRKGVKHRKPIRRLDTELSLSRKRKSGLSQSAQDNSPALEGACECVMRFGPEDPEGRAFYKGQIHNGKFHGQGTLRWANGGEYEGEWKDGLMHGRGRFYYLGRESDCTEKGCAGGLGCVEGEGKVYEGRWIEGLLEGSGCIRYSLHDPLGRESFIGNFSGGAIEGKGEMRWRNGLRCVGVWDQGIRLLWEEDEGEAEQAVFRCRSADEVKGEALMLVVEDADDDFSSTRVPRSPSGSRIRSSSAV